MKTFILAVVFLLIGGAIGGFLGFGFGTGMGAGGGLIVGTQAGTCLALGAARDKGILTSAQVDGLIQEAIGKIKGRSPAPADPKIQWIGSEADCAKLLADIDQGLRGGQ
ncbi:MAG TPA: hypothetical protein VLM84_13625 [Chromatiaceae bacterium]|jgi:ABC-type antimicrobial peptide transport system permease subunit|nr:hypothetical protein [Chromatiaceae bacterium]